MRPQSPRELLTSATGDNWAQMGQRFIMNSSAPGWPDTIAQALNANGVEAEVIGRNSVQVNLADMRNFTAAQADAVRSCLHDLSAEPGEVQRIRPGARTR